ARTQTLRRVRMRACSIARLPRLPRCGPTRPGLPRSSHTPFRDAHRALAEAHVVVGVDPCVRIRTDARVPLRMPELNESGAELKHGAVARLATDMCEQVGCPATTCGSAGQGA